MTDRGLDSWTSGLTERERVREIATTLTQPRSVDWVRKEAKVSSWQTAKNELERLVEFGQVQTIEGGDENTKYAPNYQLRYFDELADLIDDHTRDELREQIADIQGTIDAWKAAFDVETRPQLEATLTDGAMDSDEIRHRNSVLQQWERYESDKRLLRHALELYDDARSLSASE